MEKIFRTINSRLLTIGVNPKRLARSVRGFAVYIKNYLNFRQQLKKSGLPLKMGIPYPNMADRFEQSGESRGHYFNQDLLVAQRIYKANPILHLDIGSRIDGFVAHVAAFREIKVMDIRPLITKIDNIDFVQCDIMRPVEDNMKGICDSLSCLHAIEHFGLGRYNDPIDSNGHLRAISNFESLLKENGTLYLSTPVGDGVVEFDAHRIFNAQNIISEIEKFFKIVNISYIDDSGELHKNILKSTSDLSNSFGCKYGCIIVEAKKLTKTTVP